MAFTPGKIGFGEARLVAIKELLSANIEGATNQLLRSAVADTSPFVSDLFGGALTSEVVLYGELARLWNRESGCLRITVTSGGHQSGEIFRSTRSFIDASPQRGVRYDYTTDIHLYLHPDCWNIEDGEEMARIREFALERLADWISWSVLTYGPNLDLALTSQCYETQGGSVYDHLANCRIVSLQTGIFYRSFQGSAGLFGLRCVHVGDIE